MYQMFERHKNGKYHLKPNVIETMSFELLQRYYFDGLD
jgi:hypothetical protein